MKRLLLTFICGVAFGLGLPALAQQVEPIQAAVATPGTIGTYYAETTNANSFALPASQGSISLQCNNRFVIAKFNDAGTVRWFYLQLDSSSGTVNHTTTNPC